MDTNFFFSRDSEAALGSQSGTRIRLGKWEACFGAELNWEKLGGTRCSHPKCDRGRLVLDQN